MAVAVAPVEEGAVVVPVGGAVVAGAPLRPAAVVVGVPLRPAAVVAGAPLRPAAVLGGSPQRPAAVLGGPPQRPAAAVRVAGPVAAAVTRAPPPPLPRARATNAGQSDDARVACPRGGACPPGSAAPSVTGCLLQRMRDESKSAAVGRWMRTGGNA